MLAPTRVATNRIAQTSCVSMPECLCARRKGWTARLYEFIAILHRRSVRWTVPMLYTSCLHLLRLCESVRGDDLIRIILFLEYGPQGPIAMSARALKHNIDRRDGNDFLRRRLNQPCIHNRPRLPVDSIRFSAGPLFPSLAADSISIVCVFVCASTTDRRKFQFT